MRACALTPPAVRACRAMSPVAAVNDPASQSLTAAVTTGPAGAAPLVLAASSTTSGGTGDFKATSLSPSSAWQVGLQAGRFTYKHPPAVPPARGRAQPPLAPALGSASH